MQPDPEPPIGAATPPLSLRQRLGGMLLGVALAVGFASAAFFILPTRSDEARVTTAAHLGFSVQRGEQIRPGAAGQILHPGDALHFTYSSTTAGYLAVLGVDATGEVRVHYPQGERARPWSPQSPELQQSVVLDEGLGPAVFVGVFCPEAIDLSDARQALAATASTPERFALLTCEIDLLHVEKRPAP